MRDRSRARVAGNWGSIPAATRIDLLIHYCFLLIGEYMNRVATTIVFISLAVISIFLLSTRNDPLILLGGIMLGATLVAYLLINKFYRNSNHNHNGNQNSE